jgi:hypothetical protein
MPASWSRPVSECADTPSAGSMEKKLGMSGTGESASPQQPTSQTAARDANGDSGFDDVPPELSRLLAQQGLTRICVIKPVMSDADIAACRTLER